MLSVSLLTDMFSLPPEEGLGWNSQVVQSLVHVVKPQQKQWNFGLGLLTLRMVNWSCLGLVFRLSKPWYPLCVWSRLTCTAHFRSIVSRVFQRICIRRLVRNVFYVTSVMHCCYYTLFSQFQSTILISVVRLLTVNFSFLSARWVLWLRFFSAQILAPLSSSSGGCAVYAYKIYYNSMHRLFGELPAASQSVRHTRATVKSHRYELDVLRCRTSHFTRSSLPACVLAWNGLPAAVSEYGS